MPLFRTRKRGAAGAAGPGPRCECPSAGAAVMPAGWYDPEEQPGMFHAPGACPCTANLALYRRGDRVLTLCSACNTGRDEPVTA